MEKLLEIMARLRDPKTGCPWDLEQSFETVAPYTLEEAYEVVEAIEAQDMGDLKEELGDLLLQIVFHSRMAEEKGLFTFEDVVNSISDKMVRRHPHIFTGKVYANIEAQKADWTRIKEKEKSTKMSASNNQGAKPTKKPDIFADIPLPLPSLARSEKIQSRAARMGFDWRHAEEIFDKIHEELDELRDEYQVDNYAAMEEELGDLLFAISNLARRLQIDSESALRKANLKFINRIKKMLHDIDKMDKNIENMTLEEMEETWQRIKKQA